MARLTILLVGDGEELDLIDLLNDKPIAQAPYAQVASRFLTDDEQRLSIQKGINILQAGAPLPGAAPAEC